MATVNIAAIRESAVNMLPIRFGVTAKAAPRHRAVDEIERLRHRLERADLLIKTQQVQLADAEARHADDLHAALIRGCQDAMTIAQLKEQLAGTVAGIRKTQRDLIRAKAEQERLRQAVINARPKIREVPTDLVRPYSPVVVLPYISPVNHPAA